MEMRKVAIVMGSDSDLPVVKPAIEKLKSFGVPVEARVMSAHRTPEAASEFASKAAESGFGVIIAAAGKAAHLAGVLAARCRLSVFQSNLPLWTVWTLFCLPYRCQAASRLLP